MPNLMTPCTSGLLLQGLDRDLVGLTGPDILRTFSRSHTFGGSKASTWVPVCSISSGRALGPLGIIHRLEGSSEASLGVLPDHCRKDFLGLVLVKHVRRGNRLAVRILIKLPKGSREPRHSPRPRPRVPGSPLGTQRSRPSS